MIYSTTALSMDSQDRVGPEWQRMLHDLIREWPPGTMTVPLGHACSHERSSGRRASDDPRDSEYTIDS
jgi:hypothetical protein